MLVRIVSQCILLCLTAAAAALGGIIHYPEEVHLRNVKQLTFNGANAEAYFSFDNKKIVFQAIDFGSKCDQIYEFDLSLGDMSSYIPRQISPGLGVCTCSYFMPDNQRIMYASTFQGGLTCPEKICQTPESKVNATLQRLCNTTYTWDIFPSFDIFVANEAGNILQKMTNFSGYDAEATVSPNKDKIVFTSTRSGDLELWTMNMDGSNQTQVTRDLGYDGGAFFSPDGTKLVYRASRPTTPQSKSKYKELLSFNLVSPTDMELFTINVDGTNQHQVTHLGGANWAPFYHPDGKRIIFSSNHDGRDGGFNFNLFMVNENGTGKEQITFGKIFDAFPMFSFDGKKLIFSSSRNRSSLPGHEHDINLFLADWIENPSPNTTVPAPTTPNQGVSKLKKPWELLSAVCLVVVMMTFK